MEALKQLWKLIRQALGAVPGVPAPPRPADLPDAEPSSGEPPWLVAARRNLGLREIAGPASQPEIMRMFAACDFDPPNGDDDAWCSAANNYWMQEAGIPGTRDPAARSWLKWGAELKKPKPGAVCVFWRENPKSWKGHVGLYVGPGSRPGYIRVLGGNQGSKGEVSISEQSTAQLLGYRWPTTGGNSRTLRAQTAGIVVGDGMTAAGFVGAQISQPGIIEALPDALAIGTGLQSLAAYWPHFMLIGITVSILARMVTIYARVSDWKARGV